MFGDDLIKVLCFVCLFVLSVILLISYSKYLLFQIMLTTVPISKAYRNSVQVKSRYTFQYMSIIL